MWWLPLLALAVLLLCSGLALVWRRERQRSQRLAERLVVDGHIEQLTVETLRAMRQLARQQLREQR